MPSPSVKDLRMWKTERFPATGKGICWPGQEHLHCDSGGAPFALRHADQGAKQKQEEWSLPH